MHDVCIYFRRFHYIYLSTNIKNDPRLHSNNPAIVGQGLFATASFLSYCSYYF